jgi:WD40 repeat protein
VAFSPDGKTLATATDDDNGGTVRLWNLTTQTQVGAPISLPGSGYTLASGVAFSPDGKTLATADGSDNAVRLWNLTTHAQIGSPITVPGVALGVDQVAFSADGTTLATVDDFGVIRLWSLPTHAPRVPVCRSSHSARSGESGTLDSKHAVGRLEARVSSRSNCSSATDMPSGS